MSSDPSEPMLAMELTLPIYLPGYTLPIIFLFLGNPPVALNSYHQLGPAQDQMDFARAQEQEAFYVTAYVKTVKITPHRFVHQACSIPSEIPPETGVTDGYEPPSECWDSNPGPLEEQSVLFTTESSL
ncbi:hypothetical protein STEG23_005233 [Scotinomys teguina]